MIDLVSTMINDLINILESYDYFLSYTPFAFCFGLIVVLIIISLLIKLVKLR